MFSPASVDDFRSGARDRSCLGNYHCPKRISLPIVRQNSSSWLRTDLQANSSYQVANRQYLASRLYSWTKSATMIGSQSTFGTILPSCLSSREMALAYLNATPAPISTLSSKRVSLDSLRYFCNVDVFREGSRSPGSTRHAMPTHLQNGLHLDWSSPYRQIQPSACVFVKPLNHLIPS